MKSFCVAAGGTLHEKLAAQRDQTDEQRFKDDRMPLHEVRWGSPVAYQAHPLHATQWLHGKSHHYLALAHKKIGNMAPHDCCFPWRVQWDIILWRVSFGV